MQNFVKVISSTTQRDIDKSRKFLLKEKQRKMFVVPDSVCVKGKSGVMATAKN